MIGGFIEKHFEMPADITIGFDLFDACMSKKNEMEYD